MKSPKQYKLNGEEAKFLYINVCSILNEEIKGRINICDFGKKFNISVSFAEEGTYKTSDIELGKIIIYEKPSEQNKSFINHLRNAFCHLYIEINDNICLLQDWNRFKDGKKENYAYKKVTMIGKVYYSDLKNLLKEFNSERGLKK